MPSSWLCAGSKTSAKIAIGSVPPGELAASSTTARWTWGATVRGTYGTAEAGTRTQYVQYAGPWGQAALRLRYAPNAYG